MSSANNTLETEDGNTGQESVPAATSVLDKSRSLFGNSSSVLATTQRDTTPDVQSGETSAVTDPVAMEAEVAAETVAEETPAVDMQDEQKDEPMDSADSPLQDNQEMVDPEPEAVVEEEIFEKKVVSMDTSRDEEPEPMETEDNGEQNKVEGEDEIDGEEEDDEDEAPVKKAKRAVAPSEDEETSQEVEDSAEEEVTEPTDEVAPFAAVEAEGEQEVAPASLAKEEPAEANDSDDSASLIIDESAERSVESEIVSEDDATAEVESAVDPEQVEQHEPVTEEDEGKNAEPVEEDDEREPAQEETVDEEEDVDEEKVEDVEDEKEEDVGEKQEEDVEEKQEEDVEEEKIEDIDDEKEEEIDDGKEEDVPETSSSRRGRGRRSAAAAPTPPSSSTPRRGRGRASQVDRDAGEEVAVEAPKKRGRSSRGKKEEVAEDIDETAEDIVEEDAVETEETPKRGRSRRSAPIEESQAAAVTADGEEAETPKRGGRARRSTAAPAATPTPTRSRGRKSVVTAEDPVDDVEDEPEQDSEQPQKTRTPKGRKPVEAVVEEPEDEEIPEGAGEEDEVAPEESDTPTSSSRRSTRAKATPKATTATKRTPARGGRKKQVSLTEEVIDEADEAEETTPTVKKGRGAKSAPSSSKKKEFDPYDMDTEMEHHPEPLKNIQMEVKNFGTVSYAKVGNSESKYASTERAAESRIGDLGTGPSPKSRRSLADMTPGKEKVKHKMSMPSGRRSRAKREEPEDEAMEVEDEDQPSSSATPATSNRGRKRKSEAVETVTPAKKQPIPQLTELTDEEQLQVDHPNDGNEPHAPGARVFANFQKVFYPAVILAERDGLGRYKLQFTADKLVKDVPNSGIIPLRDVVSGKTAIYNEGGARVDAEVNDVSAEEWFKGKIKITILDDDDEPTDETKTVIWSELSFDQADWKDYIKAKELSATAVVTSNITTMSEAHRARKPAVVKATVPRGRTRKPKAGELAPSRDASTPRSPAGEEDEQLLPLAEEAVGKKIFAGKIFMLTSANRTTTTPIPAMFKKKNLMEFISRNGGIVTEQLDEFQDQLVNLEPLLISDTYYRTHKYLAALARGIPCVNNTWLQACGEKGECVDYKDYILPAGCSLFDDEDKPAPENPSTLLADKVVYVHSTHEIRENTQTGPGGTFVEIWRPILKLLGATVIDVDWTTLQEQEIKFDVVLVDGTFRPEVMQYAEQIGAGKVTSEWVIQTIILGGPPDATSHPKFDPYRLHHRAH